MVRRVVPDPDSLGQALAARLDQLERAHAETRTDVHALGHGVAGLTAAVRAVGTSPLGSTQDDDDAQPQPDWFDPDLEVETAQQIVTLIVQRTETVLGYYGFVLAPACWVLHPTVVADLLALICEREAAYTGDRPTAVSEWLGRWEPSTTGRVTPALDTCRQDRAHYDPASRTRWDVDDLDPLSAAAWWASDRTTPADVAFGFAHI